MRQEQNITEVNLRLEHSKCLCGHTAITRRQHGSEGDEEQKRF